MVRGMPLAREPFYTHVVRVAYLISQNWPNCCQELRQEQEDIDVLSSSFENRYLKNSMTPMSKGVDSVKGTCQYEIIHI